MAHRRTLVSRLFDNLTNSPGSNAAKSAFRGRDYGASTESAGKAVLRRVLQRRALNGATSAGARPPELLALPLGEGLREKLRGVGGGHRLQLDGIFPLAPAAGEPPKCGLSVEDARRILRLTLVQKMARKLRAVPESSIPYAEFVRICSEECGGGDQGSEIAKALNESGQVFVLGNTVFLRPEQVTKSVEAFISRTLPAPDDPRRQELEEMERRKNEIDGLARTQVRAELCCGLGFVVAQVLAAMRLTFWELSWDVMEPVCFFAASMHFAAAYAFFLRTSVEPTFEGYSTWRFDTRRRKIMAAKNFDFEKYEELCRAFYGGHGEKGRMAPIGS